MGDAIRNLLRLPRGTYAAKSDIKDAYRIIPVHPPEHSKLGICFQGKYYYDKCLAMGCSSACQIFEKFATAVHHIYEYYNPEANYLHMLDDSFLMQNGTRACKLDLEHYTELCDDLGVPWEPSSTHTVFLGVELDTVNWLAKLPMDKLTEYRVEVEQALSRKTMRRSELESLAGKLSWASCVVPACPYLRRLFNLVSKVKKPFIRSESQKKFWQTSTHG